MNAAEQPVVVGAATVELSERGGAVLARLAGEVTSANAHEVGGRVLDRLEGADTLRVDLAGVTYLSSAGLRVLVLLHRRAEAAGAKVVLSGLSPRLRFMMRAVGFLELFTETDEAE